MLLQQIPLKIGWLDCAYTIFHARVTESYSLLYICSRFNRRFDNAYENRNKSDEAFSNFSDR